MAYMTYAKAAETIKNVLVNELKMEVKEVIVVYDRGGYINNITVRLDFKKYRQLWDCIREYDFRDLNLGYIVEAYSNTFEKKLTEILNKKDKGILAASNYKKQKYLIIQAVNARKEDI